MRRRDFAIGLLLAATSRPVRGQEPAKQHRIAIVIPTGLAAGIGVGDRLWMAFFQELRQLGDVEGLNLTVERYSGEGRPERYPDLAREVVSGNPAVIVAAGNAFARAARAATDTIPIVWIGGSLIRAGLVSSLARPGGNITGVTSDAGIEISGKRLQILKEAVPSASKIAYLRIEQGWGGAGGQPLPAGAEQQQLDEASRQLKISLMDMVAREATPTELRRVFAKTEQEHPDAIIVGPMGELIANRQLIVELVEQSRLPAIYPWREYVEAGGLMAYVSDDGELWRRMAEDVRAILGGAKPGDIPIYQPTKFELLINLKAAQALGLTIPPLLLARADEVIE